MFGLGTTEVALAFLTVLLGLIPLYAGYWIIRLAVRHGAMDALHRAHREGSTGPV